MTHWLKISLDSGNPTTETAWKSNINSYGSYSYALPGEFGAREILAETLDDRLFFAGEATMSKSQATVHGAYLSGIEVAAKILAVDNSNLCLNRTGRGHYGKVKTNRIRR